MGWLMQVYEERPENSRGSKVKSLDVTSVVRLPCVGRRDRAEVKKKKKWRQSLSPSLSFSLSVFVWWSYGSKYFLLQKPMFFALATISSHSLPAETVSNACYSVFCKKPFFLSLPPSPPPCPPPLALHLPPAPLLFLPPAPPHLRYQGMTVSDLNSRG